ASSDECSQSILIAEDDSIREVAENESFLPNSGQKSSANNAIKQCDDNDINSKASNQYCVHNSPKDRYNVVLFILVLHGIGTLMPWNMFINAQ
ncbi:unnamed protein product, partial [Medioppia subpectinata]